MPRPASQQDPSDQRALEGEQDVERRVMVTVMAHMDPSSRCQDS